MKEAGEDEPDYSHDEPAFDKEAGWRRPWPLRGGGREKGVNIKFIIHRQISLAPARKRRP